MINPICSSSARRDDPRSRAVFVATAFAIALTVLAHVALAIEPLEDAVEQKFDLDADATLNVANTDGSIRIYGSDTSVISIVAIKKAYTPERLEGIVVDVKATRKSVTIATTFPPRKSPVSDKSGTVDYIIVAPQGIRITQLNLINGELLVEGLRGGGATAHLVNGWLGGHNCFADLDLTLERGRLDISYDWWENRRFSIKAASTRGNVRAILPSDTSASLSATAGEGRISNGFDLKKPGEGDLIHSVATVIGAEGETTISLEAGRGNIRIDKMY